jgi:hypothetical protein
VCQRRRRDRTGRRQFNRVARRECALRCPGAANAVDTIAAVELIVNADGVEHGVARLRSPQRIRLDDPDAPSPLLVHAIKLYAKAVGCCETDHLKRSAARHARNGEPAGRWTDDGIASR